MSTDRRDSSIVYTEKGLAIVPAEEARRWSKRMTYRHAEELLAALTKDPIAVVIREFGPGAEVS